MPALGVAQQTGTLLKWLKNDGQSVAKGEPLMEIETDKATVEIEAPASGVLSQVSAKAGDEVPVGQRIALILAPAGLHRNKNLRARGTRDFGKTFDGTQQRTLARIAGRQTNRPRKRR